MDNRFRNAEIFEDTKNHYEADSTLKDIIQKSMAKQRFISEKATFSISAQPENNRAQVKVSSKRSLEAAEFYAKQGKKVCVLNFASATSPGGGVVRGSAAQEECICRCTTLYPCLNSNEMWQRFYAPHREADNTLYNNDCIYTPQVCVFKSDTRFPEMLPRNEWWYTDIISCAAPNLRENPSNPMNPYSGNKALKISNAELEELLTSRIRRIFQLAAANENEVLILGAFGCGAFKNPPESVARVFRKVMEEYIGYFDTIEYAVYHTEREIANYNAFGEAMLQTRSCGGRKMNTYNTEIFFAENPDTPPKTTRVTEYKEIKENWKKRIGKAKEQAQLKPLPYSQVFWYVNEFLNLVKEHQTEVNDKKSIELLRLDDDNLALILDNGIIAQGCSWSTPKWDEKKHMYSFWDKKYDSIKERFQLQYQSDIIWMKFTNKGHLGVIAKSFDINYSSDNSAGKLVEEIGEKWDDSFVFIFPLTKDILHGRKTGDIERAIGNYLIMKGVPVIDFYSHNY